MSKSELSLPPAQEVINSIQHVAIVREALGMTYIGIDLASGLDGMNLVDLMNTPAGAELASSRAYEEEVVHQLRNVIPGGARPGAIVNSPSCLIDALDDLPTELQVTAIERDTKGYDHHYAPWYERQMALHGLVRAQIVNPSSKGLSVTSAMRAAAAYYRGDVSQTLDRSVFSLLEDSEIPEIESGDLIGTYGRGFEDKATELANWWLALSLDLAATNSTS